MPGSEGQQPRLGTPSPSWGFRARHRNAHRLLTRWAYDLEPAGGSVPGAVPSAGVSRWRPCRHVVGAGGEGQARQMHGTDYMGTCMCGVSFLGRSGTLRQAAILP